MTHAGFLQAIIEHPEDDAPRLIYADWLDEHGDPDRAEFIRDQVLWRPGSADYDLLADHLARWWPWSPPHDEVGISRLHNHGGSLKSVHADGVEVYWHRGFPRRLSCPWALWRAHGPAIAATAPLFCVRPAAAVPASDHRDGQPVRYWWFKRRYRWQRHGVGPSPWDVPPEVWPYLPNCGPGTAGHPTAEAAYTALSGACLAWAREGQS